MAKRTAKKRASVRRRAAVARPVAPVAAAPQVTTPTLSPAHDALVRGSSIAPEVASERGYRTVRAKSDLKSLGFKSSQCRVPALLVPIHGVNGGIVNYQIRPDNPRVSDAGKAIKYESVAQQRMVLDVPPRARPSLRDPKVDLFITEGARKADAAVSAGLCCIALLGVWNWRGTNEWGGKTVLPDWESVALNGRRVFIVFDSDVMTKSPVEYALRRLKTWLESRGANVLVIYLPAGPERAKVGLDDYLASGGSESSLRKLATAELRELQSTDSEVAAYFEHDGRMYWNRPTGDGHVPVQLANFTARIVSELTVDDGVSPRRTLEIEATIAGARRTAVVRASEYDAMGWVAQLGVDAVLASGYGYRDHARAAIQILSTNIARRTNYAHTGWCEIGGAWCYLHAGGALGPHGPHGPHSGVGVALPASLRAFELPSPSSGPDLVRDVQAYVQLFDLAPDHVMAPLIAAIPRAALAPCSFCLHLWGITGVFKTEVAALIQAHWGAGFSSQALPCNWSSTENASEMLAFTAKDAVLVVDDYVVDGGIGEQRSLERRAGRLMRGQGNHGPKQRLNADLSLHGGFTPRGIVLSTGEEIPGRKSIRARMVGVEIVAGDVTSARLTRCQADAASGLYARVNAAFLLWMASRLPELRARVKNARERRGDQLCASGVHRRLVSAASELVECADILLEFLIATHGLAPHAAAVLRDRAQRGIVRALQAHASIVESSDLTELFQRYLSSAIASGAAHLAAVDDGPPTPASIALALGWTRRGSFARETDLVPRGVRVGWWKDGCVYLEPTAAMRAAESAAPLSEPFTCSTHALGKALAAKNLLRAVDGNRGKLTVRISLPGRPRACVWSLAPSFLRIGAHGAHGAQDAHEGAPRDVVVDAPLHHQPIADLPDPCLGAQPELFPSGPSWEDV